MSAPRRPGDDRRAGRRPGRSDAPDDARKSRPRAAGSGDEPPARPVAKPARKARAEGWAKAKPPRDKPGRKGAKFGTGKLGDRKAADRPTPMREDGPRRFDGDRLASRGDAPEAAAPRGPRLDRPADGRPPRNAREAKAGAGATADRPKRSFGDNARNRAASARERGAPISEGDVPRTPRVARPAGSTLRPAYGAPRPVRVPGGRTSRPERIAPTDTRPGRPARGGGGKILVSDKAPNRAARRAVLRDATAPTAIPAAAPEAAVPAGKREPQRIAKLLARAGIASRREIERMIEERRIAIDGTPLETPATVLTSLHGVTVDGKPVAAPAPTRLFLFHKPPGVLTAERDFSGRPTIYDRLPEDLPRVMPVGRLDLNTEGLLLLTTDGEFKRKLELPSTGLPRVYRARAYGDVTQQMLEDLSDGVEIEGIRYGPIDANIERRTGANVWIEMRITEGKNREVRRVLEYLGLQVSRLIRTAYGEFILADLASGGIVEVRQNDLVAFRQTLR